MALLNVSPEGDKNPCVAAIEAARKAGRPENKGAVEDIGSELKKLFGR